MIAGGVDPATIVGIGCSVGVPETHGQEPKYAQSAWRPTEAVGRDAFSPPLSVSNSQRPTYHHVETRRQVQQPKPRPPSLGFPPPSGHHARSQRSAPLACQAAME